MTKQGEKGGECSKIVDYVLYILIKIDKLGLKINLSTFFINIYQV